MFIISASAMRSGSSWYLNMTNDLLIASGYPDGRMLYQNSVLDSVINNQFMDIGKPKYSKLLKLLWKSFSFGIFVVKTHSLPSNGTRILAQLMQIKATYIYRDPRDRLLSLLEMGERARNEGDFASPFAGFKTVEDGIEHIKKARRHKEYWEQQPQTLIVRYEDLVKDPVYELQRLSTHIGLTISQNDLELITERYNPKKLELDGKFTNYQKGEIGRYKQVLSAEQIEYIHNVMGDDLITLGYSLD